MRQIMNILTEGYGEILPHNKFLRGLAGELLAALKKQNQRPIIACETDFDP